MSPPSRYRPAISVAALIASRGFAPQVTILEIGALPLAGEQEPCHQLLAALPGSRILAFEPDESLCGKLNAAADPGVTYFPVALGKADEVRPFFETEHPMCGSLYQPDPEWDEHFHNLGVMRQTAVSEVATRRIDSFLAEYGFQRLHFIKIDVQGAEHEILTSAGEALAGVLAIVCEVEFVPLYVDQPLFGDVDSLLRAHGFMFHKFLGMAGRAMKPLVMNNDANFASQHMWADAVFVRNLLKPDAIADEDLLALAVFMDLYQSVDASHYCLSRFDSRRDIDLASAYAAFFQ